MILDQPGKRLRVPEIIVHVMHPAANLFVKVQTDLALHNAHKIVQIRIQIGVERHLEQLEGLYQYTDGSGAAALKENLLADFDSIFAKEFNGISGMDDVTHLPDNIPSRHTLTITPEGTDTGLDGQEVTVELRVVEDSYAIELTAALDQGNGKPDYVVRAELTPNETKPTLPETFSSDTTAETSPMTWRVGWIIPGAAEEEEAASGG